VLAFPDAQAKQLIEKYVKKMKKPTFIQTMNYVLAKPAQVLGITNINTFKSFISGFCYGRGPDDELPFMEEFHKWARQPIHDQ
jgi:hypothetical protein